MSNSALRMTLPVVTTLSPLFVLGVLDCWDASSGTTRTTRSLSRVWIPLMRKGPKRICQFTRLLWPSSFLAVRLVSDQELCAGDTAGEHGVATAAPVDLVPPDTYQDILIQRLYAIILSVPKLEPSEAGAPFLIYFARGASANRLYGVFPQSDTADDELRHQLSTGLPLVQSRPLKHILVGDFLESDDALAHQDVYGSVVVFRKQQSLPPIFVAVCLAQVPRRNENGTSTYEPGCKVIRDWTPTSFKTGMRLREFRRTDGDGDLLVTVQKALDASDASAKGKKPRFVGVAQVVFDRRELLAEQTRPGALGSPAVPSMLAFIGKAYSDEE